MAVTSCIEMETRVQGNCDRDYSKDVQFSSILNLFKCIGISAVVK